MPKKQAVPVSAREVREIELAMDYAKNYNHGTDGHSRFIVIAKLARALGMKLGEGLPDELILDEEEAQRVNWNS